MYDEPTKNGGQTMSVFGIRHQVTKSRPKRTMREREERDSSRLGNDAAATASSGAILVDGIDLDVLDVSIDGSREEGEDGIHW